MVVDDFRVKGISGSPYETDTPLIVYPYAMLSTSVTFQLVKSVGRRDKQGFQLTCGGQYFELSRCNALDVPGETT